MNRALERLRQDDLKKICLAAFLLIPAVVYGTKVYAELNQNLAFLRHLISEGIQSEMSYGGTTFGISSGNWAGSHINNSIAGSYSGFLAVLAISLSIIVWLQYRDTKAAGTAEFLEFLPVKRKALLRMRFLHGMTCYTVPILVFTITVLFIRSVFYEDVMQLNSLTTMLDQIRSEESLWRLGVMLTFGWLNMLSFHILLVWLQRVIKNSGLAAFTGLILQSVPWYLVYSTNFLLVNNGSELSKYQELKEIFRPLVGIEGWNGIITIDPITEIDVELGESIMLSGVRTLVFMAVGAVLFISIVLIERKRDISREEQSFYSPLMERLFYIGIAVCTAFFVPRMPLTMRVPMPVTILIMMAVTVLVYLLLRKMTASRREKYFAAGRYEKGE